MDKYIIGFKGKEITNSTETKKQIEMIKQFELSLSSNDGNRITWKQLNDKNNKNTLFQTIIEDRKKRVNKGIIMADRPNFCVVTVEENKIIRLEYYCGHDSLELLYDLRAKEYYPMNMEKYMEHDSCGYSEEGNPFLLMKVLNPKLGEELENLFNKAHDELISFKYTKYQARPSISLADHNSSIIEKTDKKADAIIKKFTPCF